jgi:hypothetical protein
MDTLDSPTIPDGYRETKNGRPQHSDGRCSLLGQPDVVMEVSIEVSEYPVSSRSDTQTTGRSLIKEFTSGPKKLPVLSRSVVAVILSA